MSELRRHLHSGHPVFRVIAWEEDEAARSIILETRKLLGETTRVFEWDAAVGLTPARDGCDGLEGMLDLAAREPGPALFLVRDALLAGREPRIARRIRRLAGKIGPRPVRVVLLSPPGELPSDLTHDVPSASYELPSFEALTAVVEEEMSAPLDGLFSPRLLASALKGLTGFEARLALRRVLALGPMDEHSLTRLFEEKARRLEGYTLEFYPPSVSFDEVGGLSVLKDWVQKRARAFHEQWGPTYVPRGVLLTGVSGCGKSFAVKALSREFGSPLFRLDMARVFAGSEPELQFTRALRAIESMSPCILWVDEIENALALGVQDTGASSRISGSFLTWLQERPDGVFVAATANRIDLLPAELLRRGRFDQIFFVDLPDEEERKRIWGIHLDQRGVNPAQFDLVVLSKSTSGWSGAEIEAAVESALIDALQDDKAVTKEHFFRAMGRTVALSVTMKEQIKKIKEWAHDRALSASGRAL